MREWELRLKAKEFLRKIRKNTVKQLNIIMQDGTMLKNNNSNVNFEKANKHPQFGRKGMGHYNQLCLMAKTAQSRRGEQDKTQEKEVPVHVRLFGKLAQKNTSPKAGYKSNNRDWQKGLRQQQNNQTNEYEAAPYLSDAAYARKKQLELLQMQLGKDAAKGEPTQADGDDYAMTG